MWRGLLKNCGSQRQSIRQRAYVQLSGVRRAGRSRACAQGPMLAITASAELSPLSSLYHESLVGQSF